MSLFTMAMTVPQVWAVWVQGQTAGVSLLSWGAYTLAACFWMLDGLRKKDKTIWVACIGWIALVLATTGLASQFLGRRGLCDLCLEEPRRIAG